MNQQIITKKYINDDGRAIVKETIKLKDRDRALAAVLASKSLSLAEKAVFQFIASKFNFKEQRVYFHRQDQIAQGTNLSRPTVERAIRKLKKIGRLEVEGHKRQCNKYLINWDYNEVDPSLTTELIHHSRPVDPSLTTELIHHPRWTDNDIDSDKEDNEKDKTCFSFESSFHERDHSSGSQGAASNLQGSQEAASNLQGNQEAAPNLQGNQEAASNLQGNVPVAPESVSGALECVPDDLETRAGASVPGEANGSDIDHEARSDNSFHEAKTDSKNDACFDVFLQMYPRKVSSSKNARLVYQETRLLYDEIVGAGIDLNNTLMRYIQKTTSPGFDRKFIKYPNRWLKDGDWKAHITKTEKEEILNRNPKDILDDIYVFVRDNTGGGRCPLMQPDLVEYCAKQFQKYKLVVGDDEVDDYQLKNINRMRRGEPPLEQQQQQQQQSRPLIDWSKERIELPPPHEEEESWNPEEELKAIEDMIAEKSKGFPENVFH